jgi:nicotinic acid phosphoribosyltransferase
LISLLQVAQLRDTAAKKDAEIEQFQALNDRAPPTGESNLLANEKLTFKPMGASPHARCMNMDQEAVQRNCKLNIYREGIVAELCFPLF